MQSSVSPVNPSFTPVSLTLTFQTQKELDCFASLLNTFVVVDALQEVGGFDYEDIDKATSSLNKQGADRSRYPSEITRAMRCE